MILLKPAPPGPAWQPVTVRGVAAFARGKWWRLWLAEALVAVLAGCCMAWLIHQTWMPVLDQAIHHLPVIGQIRGGNVQWPEASLVPMLLGENKFLSVVADLEHSGQIRAPSQVQAEVGSNSLRIISFGGFLDWKYPRQYQILLNQPELEPWWGAWKPQILAGIAAATILAVWLSWWMLSILYTPIVWLLALFANRELSFAGSVRLTHAALLPGALFFEACLVLYGLGSLNLIQLILGASLHLLIPWFYLVASTLSLNRLVEAEEKKTNPFATKSEPEQKSSS